MLTEEEVTDLFCMADDLYKFFESMRENIR